MVIFSILNPTRLEFVHEKVAFACQSLSVDLRESIVLVLSLMEKGTIWRGRDFFISTFEKCLVSSNLAHLHIFLIFDQKNDTHPVMINKSCLQKHPKSNFKN